MDKQDFLKTYNLTEEDLLKADISWDELALIEKEYLEIEQELHDAGKDFIDEFLYDIEK